MLQLLVGYLNHVVSTNSWSNLICALLMLKCRGLFCYCGATVEYNVLPFFVLLMVGMIFIIMHTSFILIIT